MRDAAVPLDMGGFDDHQRGAGIGQHAEMHQVPVIGAAVVGGILAHGRDDDAVGKLEAGQLVWARTRHWSWDGHLGCGEADRKVQRCWMDFR